METETLEQRLRAIARELRAEADVQAAAKRLNLAGDIMAVMSQMNRLANRMESNLVAPETK